jgi:arginase
MAIKIIKNRSDIGAGTRGSDLGIDALEIAAIVKDNHFFNIFASEDIPTHNESIYNKDKNSFAKRIGHVVEQCQRVSQTIARNIENGHFPILLSGDHSSALGTISGLKKTMPNKTLGVIWIDAHADIHSPYTSPSGNIHGMPLAAALGLDHTDIKINDPSLETIHHWQVLKQIEIPGAKILAEHLIYFGVRDTEAAEEAIIEKQGIKNYKVAEIRHRGLAVCVHEALQHLSHCDALYISFDVDSMDKDLVSDGTGTPVSKGFDPQEILAIINTIIASKKVICLEVVEINPLLDTRGNKMAEVAFEILDEVTKTLQDILRKSEEDEEIFSL